LRVTTPGLSSMGVGQFWSEGCAFRRSRPAIPSEGGRLYRL